MLFGSSSRLMLRAAMLFVQVEGCYEGYGLMLGVYETACDMLLDMSKAGGKC